MIAAPAADGELVGVPVGVTGVDGCVATGVDDGVDDGADDGVDTGVDGVAVGLAAGVAADPVPVPVTVVPDGLRLPLSMKPLTPCAANEPPNECALTVSPGSESAPMVSRTPSWYPVITSTWPPNRTQSPALGR
jgi:hypothetical protein